MFFHFATLLLPACVQRLQSSFAGSVRFGAVPARTARFWQSVACTVCHTAAAACGQQLRSSAAGNVRLCGPCASGALLARHSCAVSHTERKKIGVRPNRQLFVCPSKSYLCGLRSAAMLARCRVCCFSLRMLERITLLDHWWVLFMGWRIWHVSVSSARIVYEVHVSCLVAQVVCCYADSRRLLNAAPGNAAPGAALMSTAREPSRLRALELLAWASFKMRAPCIWWHMSSSQHSQPPERP